MKILIDKSTVLAYYFNQGSWENNLDRIMEMVRLGFVDAYITELSLNKLTFYLSKLDRTLGEDGSEQIKLELDQIFKILPSEDYEDYFYEESFYRESYHLNFNAGLDDIEVACEITCALRNDIDGILTLTKEKYQKIEALILILSVDEFLYRYALENNFLREAVSKNTTSNSSLIEMPNEKSSEICNSISPIYLGKWLNGECENLADTGWLVTQISGYRGNEQLEKEYSLDYNYSVNLSIGIKKVDSKKFDISITLKSMSKNFLPQNLILSAFDDQEQECSSVISKLTDEWIRLNVEADKRDRFQVRFTWKEKQFTENFVMD